MKTFSRLFLSFVLIAGLLYACNDDGSSPKKKANDQIQVVGLDTRINENPSKNRLLSTIAGVSALGDVVLSLKSESVEGALTFDPESGEVRVRNRNLFDFETNPIINYTIEGKVGDEWNETTFKITLLDVEEIPSVQELLDQGKEPWEVFKSNSKYNLDSMIGKRYGGGYIFYFDDRDYETWIVSKDNIGTAKWGCKGTKISYTGEAMHQGDENTKTILAECSDPGIAARLCDNYSVDGFDDWYLPSENEMKSAIWYFGRDADKYNYEVGDKYWSSTQEDKDNAYYLDIFAKGSVKDYLGDKNETYLVRPVRKVKP